MRPTPLPERENGEPSAPRHNGPGLWLALFGGAMAWSVWQAGIFGGGPLVNAGGWELVARFLRAAVHPDLSPEIVRLAGPSTLITLAYAVCGTALCVLLGLVLGIPCSEVWWTGRRSLPIWAALRGALAVPRAIHEAIWGLFFINLFGLDPLSAVLAIAIPFGAITARVFAEALDETPRDAFHALRNGGASSSAAFLYGLLPQAFPYLLAYAVYRFECALRAATVLGLIGAGGLGYQILLSLQSLRYEQVWTFLYALLLLVGATDAWSSLLNRRLSLTSDAELHATREPQRTPASPHQADLTLRASLLGAALLIPFCFQYVGAGWTLFGSERTARLWAGFVQEIWPPRLDPALLADLLSLSAQTLAMSILAITLAGLGGLLLAFPAAADFTQGAGAGRVLGVLLTRGVLLVLRALSESIWVLLVLFVLFPGILPGAVALGVYNLGVLGRLMAEVMENRDQRPGRALAAQGASAAQVFFYAVLPQTLPRCLAYILYRWEVCIRATAVVGIVGAGGLGRRLDEQLTRFDYPSVLTTLFFYLGLTFLVDGISTLIRRSLRA